MRRSFPIPLIAAALLLGALAAPRVEAQGAGAARATRGERRIICRGAAIPSGWILVDDLRERSMCGGENPRVLNMYNVWAIERFDDRPVGTVIQVCAAAQTPAGWEVIDIYRDATTCGHPTRPFTANVKRIRRTG